MLGGHLGFTAEVGSPLTWAEQARFTHSQPPSVLTETHVQALLQQAGFQLVDVRRTTDTVARVARRLVDGLRKEVDALVAQLGEEAVRDLTATLGTLADMLGSGRLAELMVVAQRASRA